MVCDRSQWPVTVRQFVTCRQSSFILHTYPHVCSVVILEQGILFHCLFVLLADLRDPSQTITLFNWQPIMDRVYWTLYVCHVRWYVHFWNISLPIDYACLLGRCKDCIEKCRMMLLLMRRFPDVIPKNGVFIYYNRLFNLEL